MNLNYEVILNTQKKIFVTCNDPTWVRWSLVNDISGLYNYKFKINLIYDIISKLI